MIPDSSEALRIFERITADRGGAAVGATLDRGATVWVTGPDRGDMYLHQVAKSQSSMSKNIFRKILNSVCDRERLEELRKWSFFYFVENYSLNALAYKEPPYRLVGLYSGTPMFLLRLILSILGSPSSFPEIGQLQLEKGRELDPDWLFAGNVLGVPIYGYPLSPNDTKRSTFAALLFQKALSFVIAHEISHLVCGHLDFLSQEHGLSVLWELDQAGGDENQGLLLQILETDADRTAAWALAPFMDNNRLRISKDDQDSWNSVEAWLLAVFITMTYLGYTHKYSFGDFSRNHPRPMARFVSFTHHLMFNVLPLRNLLFNAVAKKKVDDVPSELGDLLVAPVFFQMTSDVFEQGRAALRSLGLTIDFDDRLGSTEEALAESDVLRRLVEQRWEDLLPWRETQTG